MTHLARSERLLSGAGAERPVVRGEPTGTSDPQRALQDGPGDGYMAPVSYAWWDMVIRGSASATALRALPLIAVALLITWVQGTDSQGALTLWGYALLGLTVAIAALTGANLLWRPTLVFKADALVCRWWWSTTAIPWSDVEAFRVIPARDQLSRRTLHFLPWNIAIARAGAQTKIGLDYRKGVSLSPARERTRMGSQAVNLCDWAVPNFWNIPPAELVGRLNEQVAQRRAG